MIKILFVCTGNICRSPTADGVFQAMVAKQNLQSRIQTDSAGTDAYHVGEPADRRSQAAARQRGYDLSPLRARQLTRADYDDFTLLLAMDRSHLRIMQRQCPPEQQHKLRLFMDYAPQFATPDVPDPYYGQGDSFQRVLDMIEAGSQALLAELTKDGM